MNIQQIQQMMKQAKTMQDQMGKIKNTIDTKEFTETVGGGVVSVTVMGDKVIKKISINEELLEPSEKDMVEDLITMALNNAFKKIDAETEEKMGPLTNGLPF